MKTVFPLLTGDL